MRGGCGGGGGGGLGDKVFVLISNFGNVDIQAIDLKFSL